MKKPPLRLSEDALNRLLRQAFDELFRKASDGSTIWHESPDGMFTGYLSTITNENPQAPPIQFAAIVAMVANETCATTLAYSWDEIARLTTP